MNRRDFLLNARLVLPAVALSSAAKSALASELFSKALASNCDRSPCVFRAIEELRGMKCDVITDVDLLAVTDLKLMHIHLPNFRDDDFVGLSQLKKLEFFSLFHKPYLNPNAKAFGKNAFAPLSGLEELVIDEQLGELDDDVFSRLESLRVLRLSDSELGNLPRSLLEFPNLEAIYCGEFNFANAKDFDLVKQTYGDRVKQG